MAGVSQFEGEIVWADKGGRGPGVLILHSRESHAVDHAGLAVARQELTDLQRQRSLVGASSSVRATMGLPSPVSLVTVSSTPTPPTV